MGNAFVNNLGEPFSNDIVDIQRLFRKIENQKSAKLSQMIKFYNLSISHNLKADEDIKSVEEIYIKLQGEFRKQFKSIKELQPKGSDFRLKDVSGDPAKNDKNNAFYDKYVSTTGKLNAYTRKEIAQMINNIGGHFQKNPGEKTDYFIAGKFEGNSIDELKDDFQNGIDDYLENCRINGEEPEKENDKLAKSEWNNIFSMELA